MNKNNKVCYFITWNIRGLGRNEKKYALRNLVRSNKPQVMFIQETKKQELEDILIKFCCGHDMSTRVLSSPSVGASGGLATIWSNNFFEKEAELVSRNFILLQGHLKFFKVKCNLINIYAPNDQGERLIVFRELASIIQQSNLLTILRGDFNTVLRPKERLGDSFIISASKDFSNFIEASDLLDLPVSGGRFTWANTREKMSASRLDRFLISSEFSSSLRNVF
ncbi:hypothetical protein HRI_000053000 [Hibiscus trionum]|uniref:Endonuclease/exonuclease/phosphatase domain-containing protein n=1 Tax=Hibiscus trionum TaxID=183268 RepID=A0A9W7GRP4_HIBTR|nr:hypothetical protein HRI_000053000 [Hibiscus trionum]